MEANYKGKVISVSISPSHTFSKINHENIKIVAGLGIEGDAHFGELVQQSYRVKIDPTLPNRRQVSLVSIETFDELNQKGYNVKPGEIGDNIATSGIDLTHLPTGTKLYLGESAIIELTGLRHPCFKLNKLQDGLMRACLLYDDEGNIIERKAGVMSIAIQSGIVYPGDQIKIILPPLPHIPLEKI